MQIDRKPVTSRLQYLDLLDLLLLIQVTLAGLLKQLVAVCCMYISLMPLLLKFRL